MEFRELGLADFEQIAKLQRGYKTSIGEGIPTPTGLEKLRRAMENGYIRFFGAVEDGVLVATCSITRAFSTFHYEELGMLDDCFVVSSMRHKGIMKNLIDYVWSLKLCPALGIFCGDENVECFRSLGFKFPIENTLIKFD